MWGSSTERAGRGAGRRGAAREKRVGEENWLSRKTVAVSAGAKEQESQHHFRRKHIRSTFKLKICLSGPLTDHRSHRSPITQTDAGARIQRLQCCAFLLSSHRLCFSAGCCVQQAAYSRRLELESQSYGWPRVLRRSSQMLQRRLEVNSSSMTRWIQISLPRRTCPTARQLLLCLHKRYRGRSWRLGETNIRSRS